MFTIPYGKLVNNLVDSFAHKRGVIDRRWKTSEKKEQNEKETVELMYHQELARSRSLRQYRYQSDDRSVMDVIYAVGYISICMRRREAKIDNFLQRR